MNTKKNNETQNKYGHLLDKYVDGAHADYQTKQKHLGKLDNFENKLARLKEFYKKGLNQVGWNKYSRINLEFSNQIICTKRENNK